MTGLARASLRGALPPFHAMRLHQAAPVREAQGRPVFNLSTGQPSSRAPAACDVLESWLPGERLR
jgi:hypothetical protein